MLERNRDERRWRTSVDLRYTIHLARSPKGVRSSHGCNHDRPHPEWRRRAGHRGKARAADRGQGRTSGAGQETRPVAGGRADVMALECGAGRAPPPSGLSGSYWAKATRQGPPERSPDFPWLADATRSEPALAVRGNECAVHFFNDATRFNFGSDVQPGRD